MANWKVLITAPRAVEALGRYREALYAAGCEIVAHPAEERLEESELLPLVGDIDGFICGDDRVTARVFDAAPRLKVIAKWGTGVDGIDLARARECGVTVSNTPAAFCDPVADTVMGYVLLFARRLDRMSEMVRVGRWERLPLLSLRECTLGIVGLGAIGRAVATRAAAFAMTAYGYDVHMPGERELADLRIVGRPLDALLSESDFITLHADLRPDNRHLIDERRLALMRPTAVLINTARGGLIDETALVAALRDGRLAGAALDVFEREPLPSRSPLRSLPNVYLSPHNANASVAAAERVHASTIQNLLAGLSAATR